MVYFSLAAILIVLFEVLGQWMAYKFKISGLSLYSPLGFFGVLAIMYPALLITINNLSFFAFAAVFSLIIAILTMLLIFDAKEVEWHFELRPWLFIIVVSVFLTLYSYHTTLGNLHGFDSTMYLNLVTGNIANPELNSKDVFFNGPTEVSLTYYSGQVFYYIVSVILYYFGKVLALFKVEYYYATAYIWIFQVLFNFLFGCLIVEGYKRVECKVSSVLPISILLLFFGRVYFNNVYGFFGNSLLTLSVSYATLFVLEYFENRRVVNRFLVYMLLTSGCCLSSSGIYIALFYLFALFFIDYRNKNITKEYAIVIVMPLINAINMERFSSVYVYGLPLIAFLVVGFIGENVREYISQHNLIVPLLVICFFVTFGLSRFYSASLFDFSGFFENLSQRYDMTINYFYLDENDALVNAYKLFVLITVGTYLVTNFEQPFAKLCFTLIIVFFNPFSCNVLNHYVSVYYRAYVIIVNPFSLMIFFDAILKKINPRIANSISIALALMITLISAPLEPIYYHYQHKPSKTYDGIYKMEKDEMDIVRELKELSYYYCIDNPYIISGNILTQSMLPYGRYLYGRGYRKSIFWSESEQRLYEIFYTPEYLGDRLVDDADYDNMKLYLENARIDFLVVDKRVEYFDCEQNNYYSLMYKVNNECDIYPAYENETYALYHFG